MTTDWWTHIERFCRDGDTNGLLVAADGLADEGEEEMAATIRWAVRTDNVPSVGAGQCRWKLPFKSHFTSGFWIYGDDMRQIWERLNKTRIGAIEFYQ